MPATPPSSSESAPEAEPIVVVEALTKSFHLGHERSNARAAIPGRFGEPGGANGFNAVDDVSFTIHPGEAFAIIGPNGAGKSTVLKMLAGAVVPSTGYIRRPRSTVSIIELGLGFDPDLTGMENIDYGGALLGMSRDEIDAHRDEIIAFAELEGFETMPVKRYSTGMLARLGFALATSIPAALFVIDEVLSVGDWGFQAKSLDRMRELHANGATLVFVSHNLWVVNQLCERALLMERGRMTMIGPTSDVLGRYLGGSQYSMSHEGIIDESRVVEGRGDQTGDDGGSNTADKDETASERDADAATSEWRPVVIESLEVDPSEITPGGSMTLRAEIAVAAPAEEYQLLASMYWQGYATFAMPDVLPSSFLAEPGRYLLEVEYTMIPASASTTTWQIAVVKTGDTSEDPEQLLPHAIERATVDLRIVGDVTPRPGVYLPHEARVERLDASPARAESVQRLED